MSVVTEVVAKLKADTSGFTSGFKTATREVQELQTEVKQATGLFQDSAGKWRTSAGQYATAADKAAAGVDRLDREMDGLNTRGVKSKGMMGGLGGGVAGLGIAFGAAAAAGGLLVAGFSKLASEAQAALAVQRTTEQIIKSTGGAAKISADQVNELANSLSRKTGIDDEQIQSASNLLLTFKNVKNEGEGQAAMFDRATASALDLSKAGFGSVESAAKMLGKALNDPEKGITALSRAGVTFTKEQSEQIKAMAASGDMLGAQAAIMAEVESQVGGVAEATRNPMEALSTMFGNLKEQIGAALLPTINKLVDVIGPLLEQLGPPLAAVAEVIAGALSTAISALAPLLPPIAQVFGQIAGVLGGALNSVISALIPVVMPLVTILGELASQVAPVLAPILAKVAEVIGRVLQAVLPLIPPLADLVLTIFKQAGPLIDLVANILLSLVDALSPVIAAVSQLLPFMTQLVDVVFAAIMPILTPLLPVIQTLADLLGMILVKAVGLIMTGLGKWISLMAPLAGWVLNNLAKPVVDAFLTMASGVLDAADSMLGWVPGLGDKIGEAKDALNGFKDTAAKAITAAADTVATKGGQIGEDMMNSGIAMLTDSGAPKAAGSQFGMNIVSGVAAAQPKINDAGKQAATGLGDGLKSKIAEMAPGVAQEAYRMGADAAQAVKDGAQVKSPSKITMYVGRMMGEGLKRGIEKSTKSSTRAAKRMVQDATWALADAKDAVHEARKALSEAMDEGGKRKQAKAERDLERAIRDRGDATKALAAAQRALANSGKGVLPKDVLAQALRAGADAGNAALDKIKRTASDALALFTQTRDAMRSYAGITTLQAPEGANPSAGAYLANMRERLGNIRKFGSALNSLRKMGLNNSVLQDIIAAGPDAGLQMAQAILAAGKGMVGQINRTQRDITAASTRVGNVASESQYGMTGAEAKGVVTTNVKVEKGAVVINFGEGTSRADAARIQGIVDDAITKAFNKAATAASRR